MQVHPIVASISDPELTTAELAMRRKQTPKADTRKCVRQDKGRSDFVCIGHRLVLLLADGMEILTRIFPILVV